MKYFYYVLAAVVIGAIQVYAYATGTTISFWRQLVLLVVVMVVAGVGIGAIRGLRRSPSRSR